MKSQLLLLIFLVTSQISNAQKSNTLSLPNGHAGRVIEVGFMNVAPLIFSRATDNTLKMWDPEQGKIIKTLGKTSRHDGGVNEGVWFSNDGNKSFVVNHLFGHYYLNVFNNLTGNRLRRYEYVTQVLVAPKSSLAVLYNYQGSIMVYNTKLDTLEIEFDLEFKDKSTSPIHVEHMIIYDSNKLIISVTNGKTYIYYLDSGQLIEEIDFFVDNGFLDVLQFELLGEKLLLARNENSAKVYDLKKRKFVLLIKDLEWGNSILPSPNNDQLFVNTRDFVQVHALKKKKSAGMYGGLISDDDMTFTYDVKSFNILGRSNNILLHDTNNKVRIYSLDDDKNEIMEIKDVRLIHMESMGSNYFLIQHLNDSISIYSSIDLGLKTTFKPSIQALDKWWENSGIIIEEENERILIYNDTRAEVRSLVSGDMIIDLDLANGYRCNSNFSSSKLILCECNGDRFGKINMSDGTIKMISKASYDSLRKTGITDNSKSQKKWNIGDFNTPNDIRDSTHNSLFSWVFTDSLNWVIMTPDGLFDASSGAISKLSFVSDYELINIEQLKDRYYEPGLLRKVLGLSSEPIRQTKGLDNIDLYPDINLTHPLQNDGSLGIELNNRGGGIGKVKIWINGKEVTTDARDVDTDINAETVTLNYKIAGHPYLKQGEVNEIEVKAYNGEEYLSSRGKKVLYIPKGKKEDYDPTLHAVVIGTSNYSGEALDLRFAAKDAVDFSNALEMVGNKYFSEDRVNIHVLTTETESSPKPTKENIENAFKEVSTTAKPYDVLVVYLSGHGVNYGGSEGDFYYLTQDASSGNMKDPAIRESVGISSAELTEYIKMVPALKQVLILDACHSGQVAEDLMASRADRPSSEIRALERMKDRTGTYVLAGSAADAVSYETSVYGQGLLTYSLLFGMKGAALRENKFVDVVELFQYAADKVPELAEDIGGIQKPEIRTPYGGQSFDIGISDEAVQERIILPSPKPLFVRSTFMNEDTFNDNLRLSEALDEQLREFSSAKGNDQSLIFIDAARFSNAYSLKGRYIKNGYTYTVDVRMFNGDDVVNKFTISGSGDDLVTKIIEVAKNSLD